MLLRRWYNAIMDHKEELAKLITLEMVGITDIFNTSFHFLSPHANRHAGDILVTVGLSVCVGFFVRNISVMG